MLGELRATLHTANGREAVLCHMIARAFKAELQLMLRSQSTHLERHASEKQVRRAVTVRC